MSNFAMETLAASEFFELLIRHYFLKQTLVVFGRLLVAKNA